MIHGQQGAQHRVGCNHLISKKNEPNNYFIKNQGKKTPSGHPRKANFPARQVTFQSYTVLALAQQAN